jgi:DNA polymerase
VVANRALRASALVLAKDVHDALKPAIRHLLHVAGPVYTVPMPHTSGMAWNRKALDGRRWCDIGKEQVELAVKYLEPSHAA